MPWAKGKLVELSVVIVLFNIVLLAFLYRRVFPLFVLMLSLALCIGALIASLKLLGIALNLFNVLAFPLVIGVGVDYGIYVVIAMRAKERRGALDRDDRKARAAERTDRDRRFCLARFCGKSGAARAGRSSPHLASGGACSRPSSSSCRSTSGGAVR